MTDLAVFSQESSSSDTFISTTVALHKMSNSICSSLHASEDCTKTFSMQNVYISAMYLYFCTLIHYQYFFSQYFHLNIFFNFMHFFTVNTQPFNANIKHCFWATRIHHFVTEFFCLFFLLLRFWQKKIAMQYCLDNEMVKVPTFTSCIELHLCFTQGIKELKGLS